MRTWCIAPIVTFAIVAHPHAQTRAGAPLLDLEVRVSGANRLGAHAAAICREVEGIWAIHDVEILCGPAGPGPSSADTVYADIDWTPPAESLLLAERSTLGSIVFVDGRPAGRALTVSGGVALELVRRGIHGRIFGEAPPRLRNQLVARAIGRAIAHEIGHYLLGPRHTSRGLMRPSLGFVDLTVAPSDSKPLDLAPDQRAALRARKRRSAGDDSAVETAAR
jgi:hypothetical protein